ncbi:MAG: hypothetical protein NXY57DRAFT_742148 [Lentinula lateritia]|nr:MAG: hypothetical protein NXY57DRAFT_742148 [Lentinula lateritia]
MPSAFREETPGKRWLEVWIIGDLFHHHQSQFQLHSLYSAGYLERGVEENFAFHAHDTSYFNIPSCIGFLFPINRCMFWSDNTRVLRVGSPSSPHDEFSSSTSNDKTLTKINDEYETYCQAVTPPAAYPSPPQTDIDAVCKIPLPPFTSGLYPHDEEEDHPDASHSTQNTRHAMSTSPIGGALDSPLIYLQHPTPLSPPPTLPTPTALLPPAEEDHGDTLNVVLPSSLLGSSQEYHYSCNSALPFSALEIDQNDQSDSAPPNPHLLSPLSPQFVTGISAIGHVNQSPRSPSDGIGATSLEGSELDRSPLGLYSLLLDQTGIPSFASPSFGMCEEYKCPWTPRSSSNDDGTARYITKSMTTAPHLSYSSPKSSHWPHQIPLHPPSHPPFLSPHISTELPMQSEFPHPSSPSIRYIELNGPVYDGEAPGSQSPSIRTFELPELEEDEDLETGFDSGLGLSLTSFPSMSEISPAPEDSSSSFSSLSQYILQNSPSLITCSPPTSGPISKPTLESDWDTPTSNLSPANFNDAGYDSATPSSMLLLDVNIESSQNIKFNPCRLPSPNTLVESLDSRLSHLPLDSSPSDIPSYADCPEYAVLRAQPDLYQDLLRLLALHRKAQTSEKEAKIREKELVAQVELTDTCDAGEKIVSTMNVAPVKLPSSSSAVVEAEKAEAKATRKREKERRREVAAIVALTLFGGAHDTKSKPSDGRVEVGSTLKSSQTSTIITGNLYKEPNERTKKKKKITFMSMAQLVARMILRRRDHSPSPMSFSRSISHHLLFSPPGVRPRRYTKSPLWQSMTVDSEEKVSEEDMLAKSDVKSDEENEGSDDKDDVDLGTGLKLKGFGDRLEWPMTVDTF